MQYYRFKKLCLREYFLWTNNINRLNPFSATRISIFFLFFWQSRSEHYDVDIDVDVFCVVLWKWRENDKIGLPYYSIVFQIACRHAKVINPKTEEHYILYYNITVFAYQTPPIRLWIWMQKSRNAGPGSLPIYPAIYNVWIP